VFITNPRTAYASGITVLAEEHTRIASTQSRSVSIQSVSLIKGLTCGHMVYHVEYTGGLPGDVINSQSHPV
jgi:hypothetical protein